MRVRFGDVIFDADTRQVLRGTEEQHLSGKAFELLRLLIDRRPQALSKHELQTHLWPDTFVTEANLPSLVNEIREAIDDDARHPRYIATLHGFGYAFRGVVTSEKPGAAGSDCWLVMASGEIRLVEGENVLGRESAVLDSPTVSRRHARLWVDGGTVTIEDLGSKNGTFVNNEAVTAPRALAIGDQVRIGSFHLTLRLGRLDASTATTPPE